MADTIKIYTLDNGTEYEPYSIIGENIELLVEADSTAEEYATNKTTSGFNGSYSILYSTFNINLQDITAKCTIGKNAFQNHNELTTIEIPNSVVQIGECAFKGCDGLTSISLPFVGEHKDSEETFGWIFNNEPVSDKTTKIELPSNLNTINITGSLKTIQNNAFQGANTVININLPQSITKIGSKAFYNTGVIDLIIPDGVVELGKDAFGEMTSLKTVSWYTKNYQLKGADATYNSTDYFGKTVENKRIIDFDVYGYKYIEVETADNDSFYGTQPLPWKDGYVYTENDDLVKSGETIVGFAPIASRLFDPDNIEELEGYCGFQGANLTYRLEPLNEKYRLIIKGNGDMQNYTSEKPSPWDGSKKDIIEIQLPDRITSIGDYAFAGLSEVTKVSLPQTITKIGRKAFFGCEKAEFSDKIEGYQPKVLRLLYLETIEESAFESCTQLKEFNCDEGKLKYVNKYAFKNCTNLTTVILPNKDILLEEAIFFNCDNMETLSIPISSDITEQYKKMDFSNFPQNYRKYNIGCYFSDGSYNSTHSSGYNYMYEWKPTSPVNPNKYTTYTCWFTGISYAKVSSTKGIEFPDSKGNINYIADLYLPKKLKKITIRKGIMPTFYLYRGNDETSYWELIETEQEVVGNFSFSYTTSSSKLITGFKNTTVNFSPYPSLCGVNVKNIDVYNMSSKCFEAQDSLLGYYVGSSSGTQTNYCLRNEAPNSYIYSKGEKTTSTYYTGSTIYATYSKEYNKIICRGKYPYSSLVPKLGNKEIDDFPKIKELNLINVTGSDGANPYDCITGTNFYCMNITNLCLPKSITKIDDMYGSSMYFVNIANIYGHEEGKITSLTSSAFSGMTSLEKIICKIKINSIPSKAFNGCTNLKEIREIEGTNISIEEKAFYNCTSLEKLIFSKNSTVKNVATDAFTNVSPNVVDNLPWSGTVAVAGSRMQFRSLPFTLPTDSNRCMYLNYDKEYLWKLLLYGKQYDVYITDNNTYTEQYSYLPKLYAPNHNGIEVGQRIELQGENTYKIIETQQFKYTGKIFYRQSQGVVNGKISYYSVSTGTLTYQLDTDSYEVDDALRKVLSAQPVEFSAGSTYDQTLYKGKISLIDNEIQIDFADDKVTNKDFEYGMQIALKDVVVRKATLKSELLNVINKGSQFIVANSNQLQTVIDIDEFYAITIEPGFNVNTTGYNEVQVTLADEIRVLSHDIHNNEVVMVVNTKGNLYIEGALDEEVKKGKIDEHLVSLINPKTNPEVLNPTYFELENQEFVVTKVDVLNNIIYFENKETKAGYVVSNQITYDHEIQLKDIVDLTTDNGFDTTDLHLTLNYINNFEVDTIKKYGVDLNTQGNEKDDMRKKFGLKDGEELYLISCTEVINPTNYEVVSRDLEKESVIERYSTILTVDTLEGTTPQHLLVAPNTAYYIYSNNIKTPSYYFETLEKQNIDIYYQNVLVGEDFVMGCSSGLFTANYIGNVSYYTWSLQELYKEDYIEIDKVTNKYSSTIFYNYHLFKDNTNYKLSLSIITNEGLIVTKDINFLVKFEMFLQLQDIIIEKDCEKQAIKIDLSKINVVVPDVELEYKICPRSWLEDKNIPYKIEGLYILRENINNPEDNVIIANIKGLPQFVYDYSFQREEDYKYSVIPIYTKGSNLFTNEKGKYSQYGTYTPIDKNGFTFSSLNNNEKHVSLVQFGFNNISAGDYTLSYLFSAKNTPVGDVRHHELFVWEHPKNDFNARKIIGRGRNGEDQVNQNKIINFKKENEDTTLTIGWYASVNETILNDYFMEVKNIQLEKGIVQTKFEPYMETDTPLVYRGVPCEIETNIHFDSRTISLVGTQMHVRNNTEETEILNNNFQVDEQPFTKWYFKYNADARNVNIMTDKTVYETITPYATVNYTARNYKTGTITAFLGAFHKDDKMSEWTYKDSIRLQNKFQEFANNGKIKMLRDEIGNVVPVDITLKSFEYNTHTKPTNITVSFEWTQVGSEKHLTVFETDYSI